MFSPSFVTLFVYYTSHTSRKGAGGTLSFAFALGLLRISTVQSVRSFIRLFFRRKERRRRREEFTTSLLGRNKHFFSR